MLFMNETWKNLYNFSTYQISNTGRVRKTELRKLSIDSVGYHRLHLSRDNHQRVIGVHRAVWESFVGPIPPDKMINHKNGIKTDNRLENLELVTNRENIEHYKNNLLTYRGEKVNTSKLNGNKIRKIREKFENGYSASRLMRDYGVSRTTIQRIVKRKSWRHII